MTSRLALLLCLAAIGCTSPNTRICVAGQVLACACAGGGIGVQTCLTGGAALSACADCTQVVKGEDGGRPASNGIEYVPGADDSDLGGSTPTPDMLPASTPDMVAFSSCDVQMIAPLAYSAQLVNGVASPSGMLCSEMNSNGHLSSVQFTAGSLQSNNYVSVSIQIDATVRGLITVGKPIILPSPFKILTSHDAAGTEICPMGWNGTMTLVSDEPTWNIQVDATCGASRIDATFNGKN